MLPVARLAMGLWVLGALTLVLGCALPEAPATQLTSAAPLATASLPPQATSAPASAETPTETATSTPAPGRLPAGTIALYGVGEKQSLDLYALGADGSATGLGVELPPGSLASYDGRWIVHLDAPWPARAAVLDDLQDGRQYTIPLGVDCGQENCIVGLWAFDREGTRLASVEVAIDRWAAVVVDLRDGSSRRFEATRVQGEAHPMPPGAPVGWAATGELLLDAFHPFSEGGHAGVWAITLPAGGSSAAIAALSPRQLLAAGAYRRSQLSPDGVHLLYLAGDRAYTPAGCTLNDDLQDLPVNQLWSLDVAGGKAMKLVDVRDGGVLASAAAWSPDGREALLAQGRCVDGWRLGELTLKAVDATGAVREIGTLPAQGQLTDLRWCGPGLALAILYAGDGVSELHTVDLATGRTTFVAKGQQVSVLGTLRPPQSFVAEADTVAIYATVARRLYTRDDSFGGTYNPAIVYLVRQTDDRVGDPTTPRGAPVVLPEAVQNGIGAALKDLPARVVWVDSFEDAPRDPKTSQVEGHGVIVTLGNISLQEDGTVHVPASIYVANLAAAGQTYVLHKENGTWVVIGNTGVQWIS